MRHWMFRLGMAGICHFKQPSFCLGSSLGGIADGRNSAFADGPRFNMAGAVAYRAEQRWTADGDPRLGRDEAQPWQTIS